MPTSLVRFSVSMEAGLCRKLDDLVARSRYANRSEFLRDLIRERLVEEAWKAGRGAVGTVTLVYDHHKRGLTERLTEFQHRFHRNVLAATHVHVDRDLCVEAVIVRGKGTELREIFDGLRRERGVLHAALALGLAGEGLP